MLVIRKAVSYCFVGQKYTRGWDVSVIASQVFFWCLLCYSVTAAASASVANVSVVDDPVAYSSVVDSPVAGASVVAASLVDNNLTKTLSNSEENVVAEVVSLVYEDAERGAVILYRTDSGIYVPALEVFETLSLRYSPDTQSLETPLGIKPLAAHNFIRQDDDEYVSLAFLKEALYIDSQYEARFLHLKLSTPWSESDAITHDRKTLSAADFVPQADLLNRSSFELGFDSASSSLTVDGLLRGNIYNGLWQTNIQYDDTQATMDLDDYRWMSEVAGGLLSLGNQRGTSPSSVGVGEFTGVSYTKSEIKHSSNRFDTPNLANFNNHQRYFGTGPPGGIAVIEVDEVPILSKVITFDGIYDFEELSLSQYQGRSIEIVVYADSSRGVVAKRVPVFSGHLQQQMGKSNYAYSLSTGVLNNPLKKDGSGENNDAFVSGASRYGITDSTSIEAGFTESQQSQGVWIGIDQGVSRFGHINAVVSQDGQGKSDYSVYFVGGDKRKLNAYVTYDYSEEGFNGGRSEASVLRVDVSYRATRFLNTGLLGRQSESLSVKRDYFLPYASYRIKKGHRLSARPNIDGDYRVEYDLNNDWGRFNIASESSNLFVRHQQQFDKLRTTFSSSMFGESSSSYNDFNVEYRPDGLYANSNTKYRAGASEFNGQFSLYSSIERQVYPGVRLSLYSSFDDNNNMSAFLRLYIDHIYNKWRPQPNRRLLGNSSSGFISGQLVFNDNSDFDVNILPRKASILVDGRIRQANMVNGYYTLSHLNDGIYKIKLLPTGFPLEVLVDDSSYYADVKAGSITYINFDAKLAYGISGQVITAQNKAIPRAYIEVLDTNGELVESSVTNMFGFFRVDNVMKGEYQLRLTEVGGRALAAEYPSLTVNVVDDYVFEQQLMVDNLSFAVVTDNNSIEALASDVGGEQPSRHESKESPAIDSLQATEEIAIKGVIESWRRHWQGQNVEQYLSYYAHQDNSRFASQQWRTQRYRIISNANNISINIENIQIHWLSENEVVVAFTQRYASRGYNDNVNKRLILKAVNQRWLIYAEQVVD